MDTKTLLHDLVMTPGVTGFEEKIRERILEYASGFGEPTVDSMGNVHLRFGDGGVKIAVMAHMDEIGLVVSHVEKDGYIRFRKIGGVDDRMLYGRAVNIYTENGVVKGVIGLKPPHLSQRDEMQSFIDWTKLAIDVGASTDEEVRKMGVGVLDPIIWEKQFITFGNYVVTRGIDDRAGCALLIELAERLAKEPPKNEVTLIWTVQEEAGLRGARGAAHLNRFDEVYAVDTMTAGNMPGVEFHLSPVRSGAGPAIRFVDSRGVSSPRLRKKIREIASLNGIPYQEAVTGGSTDAAAVYEMGTEAIALAIPVKYTHSPVEMMHLADYRNALDLMDKVVRT